MDSPNLLFNSVPILLLTCVATLLVKRRLYKRFPVFAVYILYSMAETLLRLAVIKSYPTYFKVFWITEAADLCLALAAMYESFMHVFRAFYLVQKFRLLLPAVVIVAATYSIFIAVAEPTAGTGRLISTIISLEIGLQYIRAAIFILFVILVSFNNVHWERYACGIVDGLGVSGFGVLLAMVVRSVFGTKFNSVVKEAPFVSYILALLVWLISFAREEESRPIISLAPSEMIAALNSYKSGLKKVSNK